MVEALMSNDQAQGPASSVACNQEKISFIFVRPQFLGNIGSIARALKNFAFTRLVLIEPPNNYKDAEARMMAVGAFDVLKHSSVFGSLEEAVQNTSMLYATSCGRQRAQKLMTIQEAAAEATALSQDNEIAFVFGDEKNGLGNEEMARCHRLVQIPTNPTFPALNIAQAAGLIAYELTRHNTFDTAFRNTPPKYTRRELPTVAEENEFFWLVERFLYGVEFMRGHNADVVLNDLRRLYQRMSPTKRELDLVRGALHKLNIRLGTEF
jgi:tRNA (cytidine32/uridine32-2'-O)-methyltransferase